jgi:hypothetical protein
MMDVAILPHHDAGFIDEHRAGGSATARPILGVRSESRPRAWQPVRAAYRDGVLVDVE